MTDHLPECLLPDFYKGVWVCICKQLRACEQRVRDEWPQRVNEQTHAMYAAGVQAAREAVAALDYPHIGGSVVIQLDDALSAIDGLVKP